MSVKEIILRIDEDIIYRCRNYLISTKLFLDKIMVTKNLEVFTRYTIEDVLQASPYKEALPKDFFVNSFHRDYARDAFVITITSKEFDPVPEYGLIPQYLFLVSTNEDGTISVTSEAVK